MFKMILAGQSWIYYAVVYARFCVDARENNKSESESQGVGRTFLSIVWNLIKSTRDSLKANNAEYHVVKVL